MNCELVESCLDRLMDDSLSESELAALDLHAADCEACAEKLKAARQLKAVFAEMAPEMDVPLEAQARWRSAVRAEAAGPRRKAMYRYAGGIAAALVVLLGVGLIARPATNQKAMDSAAPAVLESAYESEADLESAGGIAKIETDGAAEPRAAADASLQMAAADEAMDAYYEPEMEESAIADAVPMREVTMVVGDLAEASAYICDLVDEYEGVLDEQRFEMDGENCSNLFIEIPASNAAEFLNAAMHYDLSGEAADEVDYSNDADGRVSLLLVLRSQQTD